MCGPHGTSGCKSDSDCTAGLDGRCDYTATSACACKYDACLTDADCPAGSDCACDANRGGAGASGNPTVCLPSNCRLDSDCGPGGYCSPSYLAGGPGGCGSQWYGFFCHTPQDECGNWSDCKTNGCMSPNGPNGPATGVACVYARELGHWKCVSFDICAG
jgi:hypothetical protein